MSPRALVLVAVCALAAGCGTDDGRHVDVFAAASLTDAIDDLAEAFETDHPDAELRISLAGSSTLRTQIIEGAPAEVFVSANEENVRLLQDAGLLAGTPEPFATNRMVIATPGGNPAGIAGAADLGDDDLLVGLCQRGVPCGDLAEAILDDAGIVPVVDTREPDVRALLARVAAGELDVAMVYASDAVAAGDRVEVLELDSERTNTYFVAVLEPTPAAADFAAFLGSPTARAILTDHGFSIP